MNRWHSYHKKIILFSIYLLPFLGIATGEDLINLMAPSVIVYKSSNNKFSKKFIIRIFSTKPDLHIEWEYGFELGAAIIEKRYILNGKNFYRWNILKNGRDIRIKGTVMFLSRKYFKILQRGQKAKLRINAVPGSMIMIGKKEFLLGQYSIGCLLVKDNTGNRYLFQDNLDFPICLSFSSRFYQEKAIQYATDSNIIFRFLHW